MKGYLKDNILFVFPQTADTIPFVDSDVTVINVQEEDILDWKEENESHADIIFPYNYNVMTVQPKVWSGHENDDIYIPVTPGLAWSAESATVTIGADDNIFPTLTNPHSVTVEYTSSDTEKATIDSSTGEITLVAAGDTTISAIFAGNDDYEAQTVTYSLTVQEAQTVTYTLSKSGEDFDTVIQYICDSTLGENLTLPSDVEVGDDITIIPNFGYEFDPDNASVDNAILYSVSANGEPLTSGIYDGYYGGFVMPESNVELTLTEVEPTSYDYELYASNDPSDTTTIDTGSIDSYGNGTVTENIDGQDITLVPCKITASLDQPQVDTIVYANADDMQYIDTTTRCKLYKDLGSGIQDTGGYVVVSTHVNE